MTTQEAYERIRSHFMEDHRFGVDTNGNCLHVTPDGARCALGCLIPDDSPLLDQVGDVYAIMEKDPREFYRLFSDVSLNFLAKAQSAHDDYAQGDGTVDQFISTLDVIAIAEFGLETGNR